MLNPIEYVVECINFDHVSCVFVLRIAQLHIWSAMFRACFIAYTMSKHSVSSQFHFCRYFCATSCDVWWVYEESLADSNDDVLSLRLQLLRFIEVHNKLMIGTGRCIAGRFSWGNLAAVYKIRCRTNRSDYHTTTWRRANFGNEIEVGFYWLCIKIF